MKCKFDGCGRDTDLRNGLCHAHYQQQWAGKELTPLRTRRLLHRDEQGRVCTSCDEYKLWSEFYLQSKPVGPHKYRSKCKDCFKEEDRVRRLSLA